jgi:MOSC domain-containing protein YiiM
MTGSVEEIFIGATKRLSMTRQSEIELVPTGIAGDRYAVGLGSFSKATEAGDAGRHLTLIEAEAIETAVAEFGVDWSGGIHRRNIVTRGMPLNGLINRWLKIGDVVLRGERHCHPCKHLEKLTTLEAMRSLQMRGGLRARVVETGRIRVGDAIHVLERCP